MILSLSLSSYRFDCLGLGFFMQKHRKYRPAVGGRIFNRGKESKSTDLEYSINDDCSLSK